MSRMHIVSKRLNLSSNFFHLLSFTLNKSKKSLILYFKLPQGIFSLSQQLIVDVRRVNLKRRLLAPSSDNDI